MSAADLTPPAPGTAPHWPPRWTWDREKYYRLAELGVFDRPYGVRKVELLRGEIWEQHHGNPNEPDPRPFRFTRDHFRIIRDAGRFDGHRVELIGGVIYHMSPINEPHVAGVSLTADALKAAFGAGYYVRVQAPLDLGLLSDPEPDVAVVPGSPRAYKTAPVSALLVVEVADTTLTHDLTTKAEQYAAAGIPDYWVLDLVNRRLLVFRDPQPIPVGGTAYRTQLTLGPPDSVELLAAPGHRIAVAELLP
jgi:Uma2 family endonuclease